MSTSINEERLWEESLLGLIFLIRKVLLLLRRCRWEWNSMFNEISIWFHRLFWQWHSFFPSSSSWRYTSRFYAYWTSVCTHYFALLASFWHALRKIFKEEVGNSIDYFLYSNQFTKPNLLFFHKQLFYYFFFSHFCFVFFRQSIFILFLFSLVHTQFFFYRQALGHFYIFHINGNSSYLFILSRHDSCWPARARERERNWHNIDNRKYWRI